MYLITIRKNIMYTMSLMSRYMENPIELYLLVSQRIFYYLKGTTGLRLLSTRKETSQD